jgi:hypothetical protein
MWSNSGRAKNSRKLCKSFFTLMDLNKGEFGKCMTESAFAFFYNRLDTSPRRDLEPD